MKIGIVGATGRMGFAIANEILKDDNLHLVSGFGRVLNKDKTIDLGELIFGKKNNVIISDNLEKVVEPADVIIDFSAATLSLETARIAKKYKKIYICGTTGFTDDELQELKSLAVNSPFLWASNMSIGVNLITKLVKIAAANLADSYDTEISETHHRYKKDAPSGTALSIGKAIAEAKNLNFDEVANISRSGNNLDRKKNEIGFAAIRGGSVIGDHKVAFISDNEKIEISHNALDRSIFASGAIYAAKLLQGKKAGFYTIQDLLT
ncbi:MAG: 4-hydroxy-tetrahydrodipicolinate reductase [Rickettsiales bacterium]|nr:4-hydroxy-tetrahydrodipicolinate reductase [Rickettsiales bacterium]